MESISVPSRSNRYVENGRRRDDTADYTREQTPASARLGLSCGEFNSSIHSTDAASRPTALLIARICPIRSLFVPGWPCASPVSVFRSVELTTLEAHIGCDVKTGSVDEIVGDIQSQVHDGGVEKQATTGAVTKSGVSN